MSRRRLLAAAQIAVNDRTICIPGIRELIRTIGGNRVRSPQPVRPACTIGLRPGDWQCWT
jgi:hypothetical protein